MQQKNCFVKAGTLYLYKKKMLNKVNYNFNTPKGHLPRLRKSMRKRLFDLKI